jgi:hypothetical protein
VKQQFSGVETPGTYAPTSVATRGQPQSPLAVIASTSAIHFITARKIVQINGGKL